MMEGSTLKRREKDVGEPADFPDGLETIFRRWPYLPEHVQRTLVELVLHYGPARTATHFPTPMGANWEDVTIILRESSTVKITVGDIEREYTFAGLGLADRRRPKVPRSEFKMLRTYAENPQPDAYFKLPYREHLKVEISKFRRWLQGFFGIPGDPLKPFEGTHWLPRFKITEEA